MMKHEFCADALFRLAEIIRQHHAIQDFQTTVTDFIEMLSLLNAYPTTFIRTRLSSSEITQNHDLVLLMQNQFHRSTAP
ncbi:hypothetical protein APZ00_16795 [Pannonibacter phragmitetus]|uniref:Uncharacterized protein n=1 Tax=Pannonibacter phragmitetus TaxID=121719 RepID=A0A0U3P9V4_9HYPH|nr:hypothetical protein APZ00_16795 [Pannonibacter phragmitetus]